MTVNAIFGVIFLLLNNDKDVSLQVKRYDYLSIPVLPERFSLKGDVTIMMCDATFTNLVISTY